MKNDYPKKEVFLCDCFSNEHQIIVCYMSGDDEFDFDQMTFEVYLNPTFGFWKRISVAIRYIFGYKSVYGDWDNFMVKHEDSDKFIEYFQRLKDNAKNVIDKHMVNGDIFIPVRDSNVLFNEITNSTPQNTTTENEK